MPESPGSPWPGQSRTCLASSVSEDSQRREGRDELQWAGGRRHLDPSAICQTASVNLKRGIVLLPLALLGGCSLRESQNTSVVLDADGSSREVQLDPAANVVSFDDETFVPSIVDDEGSWGLIVDATAVVQRGETRCFGVFYHYPSVNPENWQPPSIAAHIDNADVSSTSDCDDLLVAAGLTHPAVKFAGRKAVVVYEGFPLVGESSPDTLVVDGVPYDLEG